MEEARKEAMATNIPRKLDFNLPLLSTRRLGSCPGLNSHICLQDTRDGIPFCWEQAPGKPKNIERNETEESETPRPRLPPCRWQPAKEASTNNYVNIHDDSCDADIDDNEEDDNDEDAVFSDAVEVLSLTEAIDIVQKAENEDRLERLNLESMESGNSQSSNFMIERFLPDATAIAASCAFNKKLPYFYNNYGEEYGASEPSSYSSQSSHKGCGLDILFPWRIKHKLCGIKSPVRHVSSFSKQHKHSSTRRPFSDVIKKSL